jgi:cystathionine beta-lyase
MAYNFDLLSNRRNTNSLKWDVKENELPMWVADMDFLVFPEITKAIIEATNRGSYGYSYPTPAFFNAYHRWWLTRHDIDISTNDMVYVSGIVSSLDSLIRNLTNEKDGVLLLSPIYSGFYSVIKNNNRTLVTSNLINQNDDWLIDYEDVENKITANNVKATIFCNPHNPTGKIWSLEEIKKIYEICKRHHVIFISDEIHCDIVDPGYKYVPALKASDNIITCLAPSKVFNLAGLQSAVCVIKNKETREKMQEAFYHDDIGEPNYFVEPATVAAYNLGDNWVDELNAYLLKNKNYVKEYIAKHLPHLKVVSGHATYLMWIDTSYYQIPSETFKEELRNETGLYLHAGSHYGDNSDLYMRINIATSLENVKDAMHRLSLYLKNKEK